jgi:plastocyanin
MVKFIFTAIVLLITIIAVAYFLFIPEEKKAETQGTTTTLPASTTITVGNTTTTTVRSSTTTSSEENKTFVPVQIKPAKNEIFIYSDKFEPSSMTINLGEQVKWINKDSNDHIIVLSNPPLEKRILAGDSFSFQFISKGVVEFTDRDTGVKGSITVS